MQCDCYKTGLHRVSHLASRIKLTYASIGDKSSALSRSPVPPTIRDFGNSENAELWLFPLVRQARFGCCYRMLARCRKQPLKALLLPTSSLFIFTSAVYISAFDNKSFSKESPRGIIKNRIESNIKWLPQLYPPRSRRSPTRALSSSLASGMLKSESGISSGAHCWHIVPELGYEVSHSQPGNTGRKSREEITSGILD